MRHISVTAALAAVGLAVGSAPAGAAQAAPNVGPTVATLDLLTDAAAQIDGAHASDYSGYSIGGGGDYNNDGERDLLIGTLFADPRGRTEAGAADVVFGPPPPLVRLHVSGRRGYEVQGAQQFDLAGSRVADAGDVNGDGVDDFALSAPSRDAPAGASGTVYVVFGRTGQGSALDLGAFGSRGFRINGAAAGDAIGRIAAAGDVNGDGLGDLLIGSPSVWRADQRNAGAAYVVFGKTNDTNIDLGSLGGHGYKISGVAAGDQAGTSVANAGDVNGDGHSDQLIGVPQGDLGNVPGTGPGGAYVLFGKINTTPVDLGAVGAAGYRIGGEAVGDLAGLDVDNAGDVNGDGRPDQLIGAPRANDGIEGAAYVVHGKTSSSTVELAHLTAGYEIPGVMPNGATGRSVAGLGDVNGDGRRDQIIGASGETHEGRGGSAYVVRGQAGTAPIHLLTFTEGFRIDGAQQFTGTGEEVVGPGDLTGDGHRDALIGAEYADANGLQSSGSTYVVDAGRSGTPGILSASEVTPSIVHPQRVSSSRIARTARATIRYRLGKPARVTLRIFRLVAGRRTAGTGKTVGCAAGPAAQTAGRRRCTSWVPAGTIVVNHRRTGAQRVPFSGVIKRKPLPVGRYVLFATARDRKGRIHGPARADFRVAK